MDGHFIRTVNGSISFNCIHVQSHQNGIFLSFYLLLLLSGASFSIMLLIVNSFAFVTV